MFELKRYATTKKRLLDWFWLACRANQNFLHWQTPNPKFNEAVMRKYIRHPSHIPIDFQLDDASSPVAYHATDVSHGGLCFQTALPMPRGKRIRLRIPFVFQVVDESGDGGERFEADGVVAWCRKENGTYAVGVQFLDPDTRFGVRMVEQVCHIEHYRHDVLLEQGRSLTSEEAAREWVERYAAEFPC